MNELIETLFANFTVNKVAIPVSYMFYQGHGEPYVVYSQIDAANSLSGDDGLIGYVDYYDFDIYSKGNWYAIAEAVKETLTGAGFVWQPSLSSRDMYETETGYYHKILNFAIYREE